MTTDQQVEVGTKLLVRAVLMFLGLVLLFMIRDIIILTFLAIIVSSSLSPIIKWLHQKKLHRASAVVLVYLFVLVTMGLLVALIIPPFVNQIGDFASSFPNYLNKLSQLVWYFDTHYFAFDQAAFLKNVQSSFTGSFSGIFSKTVGFFSGLISFIVFFFLSLYMSLEEDGIEKFLVSVTPVQYKKYVTTLAKRTQTKISHWLLGQLVLMITVFLMYFIGLSLLGVPYALLLAILGGALEIIPYVGPIIAAIPAVLMGALISPVLGLSTLIFYTVAHQIESHVITPQVMKRAIGVNPVAIILSLLIGAKMGGLLGIILAVPAAAVIGIFVEDFLEKRKI
jgi:predicted PurR-regulated permease PerM